MLCLRLHVFAQRVYFKRDYKLNWFFFPFWFFSWRFSYNTLTYIVYQWPDVGVFGFLFGFWLSVFRYIPRRPAVSPRALVCYVFLQKEFLKTVYTARRQYRHRYYIILYCGQGKPYKYVRKNPTVLTAHLKKLLKIL